ncbi:hypothetical protein BC834DRAFT_1043115 [Gloeopeniophorella convolvens]|nr:hypothetical protein BC834DRAFT_1043115 [Gloeopeniophorella convolvens]
MTIQRLLAFPKQASSEARGIVLDVIRANNAPLSTRELFEKSVKVPAPRSSSSRPLTAWARHLKTVTPLPPHPDHPVRSLSYLKHTVMEDLLRTRDVKKVHVKRVLNHEEIQQRLSTMTKAQLKKSSPDTLSQLQSTWMWQVVEKSKKPAVKAEAEVKVFGAEVGVGEDWSHLNKRRRRAREGKVARDVKWMRKVQRARENENSEPAPPLS